MSLLGVLKFRTSQTHGFIEAENIALLTEWLMTGSLSDRLKNGPHVIFGETEIGST